MNCTDSKCAYLEALPEHSHVMQCVDHGPMVEMIAFTIKANRSGGKIK